MINRNLCCVINLQERKDRYEHIIQTIKNRKEFDLKIYRPLPHTLGSYSLWITIKRIIEAIDTELEYFIFCEDDHEFTSHYSIDLLQKCINEVQQLEADILCGGVSWFKTGVQISKNLFWVEKFTGLQFTVIFKRFYQRILEASFTELDQADYKISQLTKKKFVIYPYLSTQKEFGYSDVTSRNHEERRVERLFTESSERFSLLQKIEAVNSNNSSSLLQLNRIDIEQINLPLYIITDKMNFNFCSDFIFGFNCRTIQISNNHQQKQWKALCKCIDIARRDEDDFFILTFDPFNLKKNLTKLKLVQHIIQSTQYNCDILLGNIENFNHAVPVNENMFWIDSFSQSSFIILFANAYEKISSNPPAHDEVNIYNYLSYITSHKIAVYPFISEPQSLLKKYNSDIQFQEQGKQLAVYQKIFRQYLLKERV